MAKLNTYSVVFNGAGAVIALIVGTYVVRDMLSTDQVVPCSTRYPAPAHFVLETQGGTPMSPIELQARAGINERGVLQNAKAVRDNGAPAPTLLEVELAPGKGGGRNALPSEPAGITMSWAPSDFGGAGSACLSYSVWIPQDFPFGSAGTLPGIVGGGRMEPAAAGEKRTGFAARPMWRDGGNGEVLVQTPTVSANGMSVDRGKFALQRGRWVAIEQEVALNTPGKPDGILRLWVDGTIRSDQKAVLWREEDSARITSVVADIGYGSPDRRAAAPHSTTIRFTPFELRWQ